MNRSALFALFFLMSYAFIAPSSAQNVADWHPPIQGTRYIEFNIPGAPNIPPFYFFGDGHFAIRQNPVHHYHTHGSFDRAEVYSNVPNVTSSGVYVPTMPSKVSLSPSNTISIPQSGLPAGSLTNRQWMNGSPITVGQSWAAAADEKLIYIVSFTSPLASAVAVGGTVELELPPDVKVSKLFNPGNNSINTYNDWADSGDATRNYIAGTTSTIDKVEWNFNNLHHGEIRHLYIEVDKIPAKYAGNLMTARASLSLDIPNASTIHNQLTTAVSGRPRDPNAIEVNHPTIHANIQESHQLEYTVNFQNDGNYYAHNVIVDVTLDGPLEGAFNVQLVDSKFPDHISIGQVTDNTVQFTFYNLMLPGSNQEAPNTFTYDQTEGWLKFKICTNNFINTDQLITAGAAIYFDNELPIFTNIDTTEALIDNPIHDYCDDNYGFAGDPVQAELTAVTTSQEVYPNPFSDQLNISYEVRPSDGAQVDILLYAVTGQQQNPVLFSGFQEQGHHHFTFNAQHLPGGTYILEIRNGQEAQSQRLIKMH
jgi:hypothetical protein